MASLLSWFGNKLHDLESGLVGGAESLVGMHPNQGQTTPPNFQSAPPAAAPAAVAPPVNPAQAAAAGQSILKSINQATGVKPPQFTAPQPSPTVMAIDKATGGSPVAQINKQPTTPAGKPANPVVGTVQAIGDAIDKYGQQDGPLQAAGKAIKNAGNQSKMATANTPVLGPLERNVVDPIAQGVGGFLDQRPTYAVLRDPNTTDAEKSQIMAQIIGEGGGAVHDSEGAAKPTEPVKGAAKGGGKAPKGTPTDTPVDETGNPALQETTVKNPPHVAEMGEQLGRLRAQIKNSPAVDPALQQQERQLAETYSAYKQGLSPEELQMGQALGLSPMQTLEAKVGNSKLIEGNDKAAAKAIDEHGIVNPSDEKTGSKTAAATEKAIARVKSIKTWEENTEANPVKVKIPQVKEGDYEQARVNAQLASNPYDNATRQMIHAYKGLSEADKQASRYAIEDPSKATTPELKEFIRRYRYADDIAHGTSQSLGGNTNYLSNHFHREWNLDDPEQAAKMEEMAKQMGISTVAPEDFQGIDWKQQVFPSIKAGEAAGFTLKHADPLEDFIDHASATSYRLKMQALIKGMTEADTGLDKTRNFDLKNGKVLPMSDKGIEAMKGFDHTKPTDNPLAKAYRWTNRGLKGTLLSLSEFHPINISALRAAPTLLMKGHPILATEGLYGTFRAQVGTKYIDSLMEEAQHDGVVDFGARVGSPLRYGSDFSTGGKLNLGHLNVGERTVFEKAIPAMHVRALQALRADLDHKGIPYDSPEAHAAGTQINRMMGFINTEVQNLEPRVQRNISDVALAPQFTRSKWQTLKAAFSQKGVAGSYARRSFLANAGANFVVAAGIGFLVQQKSDDLGDMLMRALFDPSVPTPFKDSKGNTLELGLPNGEVSEFSKLAGVNLHRDENGHLVPEWKPGNIPGNLTSYGRSRLAMIPGDALKLATNTNYAGRPLFDPNADLKTRAEQAATTLTTGALPIGLQGLPQINAIKQHLPQAVQDVLDAQATSGGNPLTKSVSSSFGLTPKTDKYTGKGLESTAYFSAIDQAKSGLNRQEKDALDLYTGSKKNPVTGNYDVMPNAWDTVTKAAALSENPKVVDRLIEANKQMAAQGSNIDPLWLEDPEKIKSYFNYQADPDPNSAQHQHWINENASWYQPLQQARSQFFDSLPKGDPNKPAQPVEYPVADSGTQKLMDQYFATDDSKAKAQLIKDHPEIVDQFDKQFQYKNDLLKARGLAAYKDYPKATPSLQKFIDGYTAADKATRKGIRNSNPGMYQNMVAYFDSTDLKTIGKEASVNQLQGEPDTTQKELKAMSGLSRDIYQNPDGSYSLVPAGWMQGLGSSSGSRSGFSSSSSKKRTATRVTGKLKASSKPHTAELDIPKVQVVKAKSGKTSKVPKIANHNNPKPPKLTPTRKQLA